ncbi:MAG: helicase, partial [Deinococcota bacterium]|nr:helicase [Deinococcota bacterium]
MGLSFLVELEPGAELVVEVSGGQYRQKKVTAMDKERTWWLRSPVSFRVVFPAKTLMAFGKAVETFESDPLLLGVEIYTRAYGNHYLITVSLINRTSASTSGSSGNEVCLFQSSLKVEVSSPAAEANILPYPSAPFAELDDEEQSLALLYRKAETYAVGHGCAADWEMPGGVRYAKTVFAVCLPQFETPSTTPDITREDGSRLEVPMALLGGLVEGQDGLDALEEIVERYENWIREKRKEVGELEPRYHRAANRHLNEGSLVARRMRGGLDYLKSDATALRAFQLANRAILIQQVQSKRNLREASFDRDEDRFIFSPRYEAPDILTPKEGRGRWRAFQIAFLLMSLQSSVEGVHPDRNRVELIWFPTGGGKTEAYLGLAAFTLFMRRLKDSRDAGVQVLMRYTLRLLTAQQFQRASALICAMEHLRRDCIKELGEAPFSIGIWLGGATTPNSRRDADISLKDLERKGGGENPFILGRCPWCAAQMGVFEGNLPKSLSKAEKILGYRRTGIDTSRGVEKTVVFCCPDRQCEFSKALPVYVIDEDIYDKSPSLVIGTVDKFAVLAWRSEARSLFGLASSGERQVSPPGLIIQDELHLISGPLGSMVGLYEALIEELCTDRRGGKVVPPKIVCSTATIRSYLEQIKALYARNEVTLFPPPGLEDGDSFFARHARDADGNLLPGRRYVGVNAPGLRSLETSQERTFAALLQAPMPLSPEERDPWWTLMLFFGSLRELGTSLSLFQSRIPDYFKTLRNRFGLEFKDLRYLYRPEELTGR